MDRCSSIRVDGGRCRTQLMRNSEWCISHYPDHAEARQRRASKGVKRGGRGRPLAELAAEHREKNGALLDLAASRTGGRT